jgi:hypothetical protein
MPKFLHSVLCVKKNYLAGTRRVPFDNDIEGSLIQDFQLQNFFMNQYSRGPRVSSSALLEFL